MVYCGRPSTSCNSCRAKKRRCDKAVPACGQCIRKGQQCPGYRDLSDLTFRDESRLVIDKARSRISKKTATSSATNVNRSRSSGCSRPQLLPSPSSSSSPPSPSPSLPLSLPLSTKRQGDVAKAPAPTEDHWIDESLLGIPSNTHGIAETVPEPVLTELDDPRSIFASFLGSTSLWPTMTTTGADSGDGVRIAVDIGDGDGGPAMGKDGVGEAQQGEDVDGENDGSDSGITAATSIARPFSLPLDSIGLNFFLSHYVVRRSPVSSGFLDYTVDMISRHKDGHFVLDGAILALGFSGLARETGQVSLTVRSRAMYTRTIERVNGVLTESRAARQNSTIVTALILAIYEFSEWSLEGWDHHMQGVSSLLTLRGKSQCTTEVGQQIFKDVFAHLLISCIRHGCPIPSNLRMLRAEWGKVVSASEPFWVASSTMIELLDLYELIAPGRAKFILSEPASSHSSSSPPSFPSFPSTAGGGGSDSSSDTIPIDDLERYLSQSIEMDHRLQSSFSECPPEWRFTINHISSPSSRDPTQFLGDTYHVYNDATVASVWNIMRACRIMANHAICHLLLRGAKTSPGWFFSGHYADLLQKTAHTMTQIRDDALASVPQQMGYVSFPNQQLQNLPQFHQQQQHEATVLPVRSDSAVGLSDTPRSYGPSSSSSFSPASYTSSAALVCPDRVTYSGSAVGKYFVSWILLTLSSMHSTGDEVRAWVLTQLHRINSPFAGLAESNRARPPLG